MARGVQTGLFWYEVSDAIDPSASSNVAVLLELDRGNVGDANGKSQPLTASQLQNITKLPIGIRVRKNKNQYGLTPRSVVLALGEAVPGNSCYAPTKYRNYVLPILTLAQFAAIQTARAALAPNTSPANFPAALKFSINHSADFLTTVDYYVVDVNQQVFTPNILS